MTVLERFHASYVEEPNTGCYLWIGCRHERGYGRFYLGTIEGRIIQVYAHDFAWEIANGEPVPPDLFVLHHCDMPPCVNPEHLFLGTSADNSADMVAKGRQAFGERNSHAKLTEEQVFEIRASVGMGIELAAHYGVSPTAISRIRNGRTWRLS